MNRETWWASWCNLAVPCPNCGGRAVLGHLYDWPPELGGGYLGDEIRCLDCKKEWTADDAPESFTAKDGECWNVDLEDATG
jgi:hypothetical protein